MGNLTPKPINQQTNKKLTSNEEKANSEMLLKDNEPRIKKMYKKLKIRNKAPNWVQKNIK
jgi:hypothetical protein